jgi:L-threonylcarbamoyladenylate synthase
VLVPTESSHALAASCASVEALDRLRAIKARQGEGGKPILLLCASFEQAARLAHFSPAAARLARAWPCPLTLLLEPVDAALAERLGSDGIALRVPAHDVARRLALLAGPFTGTSANRAGEPPLLDPALADSLSSDEHPIAGILDAGILPGGPPSTLVDARNGVRILRLGAFPESEVTRLLSDSRSPSR